MFFKIDKTSKRNPILLEKLKQQSDDKQEIRNNNHKRNKIKSTKKNYIIAITGTSSGSGCTFISLNLAFNLAKSFKVALVELNCKSELKNFSSVYDLKNNDDFAKLGQIDMFFYGTQLSRVLQSDFYDYIILDTGYYFYNSDNGLFTRNMQEIYRADSKIAVADLREWKQQYVAKFIDKIDRLDDWFFIANLPSKSDYNEFRKIMQINSKIETRIMAVDFIENFYDNSEIAENLLMR